MIFNIIIIIISGGEGSLLSYNFLFSTTQLCIYLFQILNLGGIVHLKENIPCYQNF